MSDERLRELERRWKETGSVEDEAAWLLERVRVGQLHLFVFGYQTSPQLEADPDAESSNCVWIEAESTNKALEWGQEVARAYCAARFPNQAPRNAGDYAEWLESKPETLAWAAQARLPLCRIGEQPTWPPVDLGE